MIFERFHLLFVDLLRLGFRATDADVGFCSLSKVKE